MKSTEKLMDMLCKEIDAIAERGQLSAGELDAVYKLIVSKEKLMRCEELEESLGYSQADGSYSRGNSYGRHYVRGHYSRGRGRYSMAEGNDMLMDSMQSMMDDPGMSEYDRSTIRRAMEVMRR